MIFKFAVVEFSEIKSTLKGVGYEGFTGYDSAATHIAMLMRSTWYEFHN